MKRKEGRTMATSLEGKELSLWVGTTKQTDYPKLTDDDTVYDLLVVGGGITGVVAAYHAQQRGLKTVLVEKSRLVEWTTGSTTAKLSSQHYLVYDYLIKQHGIATAQSYADANQNGIDRVESISRELGIDCEFSRRDAFVYTQQPDKVADIQAEVEAARQLGIMAAFVDKIELPYDISGAVRFAHQAQFHPRKFLLALAEHFTATGGVIYEQTKATDITPGDPHTVTTELGDLKAKHILQASGEPFWNKEIFDGHMWTKMSYALAVTLKDPSAYPKGMYITTDDPMRTIRSAGYTGEPVLIYGGESHEYDETSYDADLHYQHLLTDVHRLYPVDKVLFRWLAGDYMPYDRMPYIGAMPGQPTIYTITGYRAWGLAWAMSATEAVIDEISGTPAKWVEPFGLERLNDPPADKASAV